MLILFIRPYLLSQILLSGKQSAKEFLLERRWREQSIVNRFYKSSLELVCITVRSSLFNEMQELKFRTLFNSWQILVAFK